MLVVAVLAGAGVYWFQPWKLWTDEEVNDALPQASASSSSGVSGGPGAAGPRTVARGGLISHEHATTGSVKVVELPDGSRTLRLENLDTSNGPDLRVWLTDAPVKEGVAGWRVFDDGKYVSLGKLKGNKGDQNYPIPADVRLDDFTSVAIWCDRFDVSFGAAELSRI
ncbi:DM13 domain-containing protein [Streptomyces sp. NPDC046712]|uniref:DM13 domain-containing protein n=1 Tax=Streptomyces sp. NPDC046712 TaxID=3154802 RepID=UPI0034016127